MLRCKADDIGKNKAYYSYFRHSAKRKGPDIAHEIALLLPDKPITVNAVTIIAKPLKHCTVCGKSSQILIDTNERGLLCRSCESAYYTNVPIELLSAVSAELQHADEAVKISCSELTLITGINKPLNFWLKRSWYLTAYKAVLTESNTLLGIMYR